MGRVLLVLGLLLTCAGIFLILTLTTSEDGRDSFDNFLASTLCQPDETLEMVYGDETVFNSNTGSSESVREFYCISPEGVQQKDVTGMLIALMIAAFVVPFAAGIILIIAGFWMNARRKARQSPAY